MFAVEFTGVGGLLSSGKVVFLPIRKEILTNKGFNLDFSQYDFGWPSKFRQKGFFWTHSNDIKEFKRVLDFLINKVQFSPSFPLQNLTL